LGICWVFIGAAIGKYPTNTQQDPTKVLTSPQQVGVKTQSRSDIGFLIENRITNKEGILRLKAA